MFKVTPPVAFWKSAPLGNGGALANVQSFWGAASLNIHVANT
ncbi:hypothetical protein QQL38_11440 [Pseudomonas syringae]